MSTDEFEILTIYTYKGKEEEADPGMIMSWRDFYFPFPFYTSHTDDLLKLVKIALSVKENPKMFSAMDDRKLDKSKLKHMMSLVFKKD